MNIGTRLTDMGKLPALVGAWAIIASIAAIGLSLPDIGETWALSRVAIGVIGLAAGALFWSGRNHGVDGMRGIVGWGALQLIFYADTPDGNWTRQLIDGLLGASSEKAINGQIVELSQVGINMVGVIIVVAAISSLKQLEQAKRRASYQTTAIAA